MYAACSVDFSHIDFVNCKAIFTSARKPFFTLFNNGDMQLLPNVHSIMPDQYGAVHILYYAKIIFLDHPPPKNDLTRN